MYNRYSGALYGVVIRILIREEMAEEVLHDAFLKIWDRIDSYDASKGRLFTWMLNVCRNLAIDKTRSKEFNNQSKTRDITNLVSNVERSGFIETSIDSIGLSSVMKSLSEEQQFVIEHLYFKGYTQSELAEEFNIPLGTVKTRLRLAMQQLRIVLKVQ